MTLIPGVLHVLSQPETALSLEEFHQWYDEEHGPARMQLNGFKTGLRYQAIDGLNPAWAATYELEDISLLNTNEYVKLRSNRSTRELNIISRLQTLDRYIYRLVYAEGSFNHECVANGEVVLVTVLLKCHPLDAQHIEQWYIKEHINALGKVPGWLRSRLLRDSSKETAGGLIEFFAMHEYSLPNGLGGPEHKAAKSTPWRTQIMTTIVQGEPVRRTYQLYRVFEKINSQPQ